MGNAIFPTFSRLKVGAEENGGMEYRDAEISERSRIANRLLHLPAMAVFTVIRGIADESVRKRIGATGRLLQRPQRQL